METRPRAGFLIFREIRLHDDASNKCEVLRHHVIASNEQPCIGARKDRKIEIASQRTRLAFVPGKPIFYFDPRAAHAFNLIREQRGAGAAALTE